MAIESNPMKLTVDSSARDELYRDIVRINLSDRGDGFSKGGVIRIWTAEKGKPTYAILRGNETQGVIQIDRTLRGKLGIEKGKPYTFTISQGSWRDEFCWAWTASDPAYRIAAKLGILSILLGTVGAALGIWSVILAAK